MDTQTAIAIAVDHLEGLRGHVLDLLTITQPVSPAAAVNLAKIVSKLSPLLGNLIEFFAVDFLNKRDDFAAFGRWKRQDPGFPDAIFEGRIYPAPGFEIKAWFPMATEITARFKDSQDRFMDDHTYVVLLAWLPEHLIYGRPYVLDICIVSGKSVAAARDTHYHRPPHYLVIEPGDTAARTVNLRQTNTSGYVWQGTDSDLVLAEEVVLSWGDERDYSTGQDYQRRVAELISRFKYRLDTNYAKIDRIVHPDIERFKSKVLGTVVHGLTVRQWARVLSSDDDAAIEKALRSQLPLKW